MVWRSPPYQGRHGLKSERFGATGFKSVPPFLTGTYLPPRHPSTRMTQFRCKFSSIQARSRRRARIRTQAVPEYDLERGEAEPIAQLCRAMDPPQGEVGALAHRQRATVIQA